MASSTDNDTSTGGETDPSCDVAIFDPDDPPATLELSGNLVTHDPTVLAFQRVIDEERC